MFYQKPATLEVLEQDVYIIYNVYILSNVYIIYINIILYIHNGMSPSKDTLKDRWMSQKDFTKADMNSIPFSSE